MSSIRWADIFRATPDEPRPLTPEERRRLIELGYPEVVQRLDAGLCPDCGHHRASSFHREKCGEPQSPRRAPDQPRQPWQPKASRRHRPNTGLSAAA